MLVSLALVVGSAHADTQRADLQLYHPAATSSSFLGLDSPTPLPNLAYEVGLVFSGAHDPLTLRDGAGLVAPGGHIVTSQSWLEATVSVGLWKRFELGAGVPIALNQGGDAGAAYDPAAAYRSQRGAALGNLRFDGKILLVDHELAGSTVAQPFALRLSLILGLTVPSGTTALAGDENVSGLPRLVLGFYAKRVELVASLGAVFRERVRVLNLDVTQQVTWGLGVRGVLWYGLDAALEARGAVGVAPPSGQAISATDVSAEIDLSLGYRTPVGIRPYMGGGIGLGAAYGVPAGRFIVGARYDIPERRREAPWEMRDDDHDTLRNEIDRCPREAGPVINGGCPPVDRDHDGVPDSVDQCPDTPGVPENQGCPDVDSDGDGWVDRLDRCPFDVEIYNGVEDDDGCPDAGPALAGGGPGQVVLFEPIVFEKSGAGEKLSARSLLIIDALGGLLRAHKEWKRVRVDGHTDNRGDAIDNLDRSLRRAQAVRKELVSREHIDPARLTAQGFGSDRPLVDNATPQGRARNRRIEITILDASH